MGLSPSPSFHAPPQYDIGAPLMTIGPVSSGLAAASIIAAQPPWQLPTMAGLGLREEDHEVDRMAFAQRDAHLGIVLEAADARAVASARIDDHVRPALRID